MNTRGLSFICSAAALLVLVLAATRARAEELLAHGTREMFWIARLVPAESRARDSEPRTLVRARSVGTEGNWSTIAQLGSRVTSLANRGTALAALLDSGSWLLLWSGGSSMGALPDDGATLLLLASDEDAIWALGVGGRAMSTTSTTEPAEDDALGDLALYKLERGRWQRVAWLDNHITSGDLPRMSMTVARSMPILSILRFGGSVETIRWEEGRFVSINPLPASDTQQIKLMSDGERAILWSAPASGAGQLRFLAEDWSEPKALEMNDPPRAQEPRTIALANNIRLLFIRDQRIFEQTFDRSGVALRPTAVALQPPPIRPDTAPNRILSIAAAVMLMVVVLSSLRSGGGAASTALAAGVTAAPLLLRALAGGIDALPLVVPCYFIFRNFDPSADNVDVVMAATSWPFYTSLAGYLLYNWLFEALFRSTPGKMLCGLQVCALDGSRPTQVAIFARNVLRLVDVTMLAVPLVLVLLSPLRQRVGDIAARTIVVSRRAREPTTQDHAEA